MKKRSWKNKGQICYIIQDSDIKSVEFIKIINSNIYIVKDTEINKEQYIHSNLVYDTEEEAYKDLLTELKYYKDGSWQVYDSWEDSGNRFGGVDELVRVTPGYTYRVYTTHKVFSSSGALLETFTDRSSNTITSPSRS